jgi:hypothetical protein
VAGAGLQDTRLDQVAVVVQVAGAEVMMGPVGQEHLVKDSPEARVVLLVVAGAVVAVRSMPV